MVTPRVGRGNYEPYPYIVDCPHTNRTDLLSACMLCEKLICLRVDQDGVILECEIMPENQRQPRLTWFIDGHEDPATELRRVSWFGTDRRD